MSLHSGTLYAKRFFNRNNAPSYNIIVKLATFGQDIMWKREIIKPIKKYTRVLELANGTGILSKKLIKNKNIVYGIDLTFEYLRSISKDKINILAVNGTAESLPFRNSSFDFIISSYLPKYVNLKKLVDECYNVLNNDGILILHDFTYPEKRFYRFIWKEYFRLLRCVGKSYNAWAIVFNELDTLIMENEWYKRLPPILTDKGFSITTCQYFTFETSAVIVAKKNE